MRAAASSCRGFLRCITPTAPASALARTHGFATAVLQAGRCCVCGRSIRSNRERAVAWERQVLPCTRAHLRRDGLSHHHRRVVFRLCLRRNPDFPQPKPRLSSLSFHPRQHTAGVLRESTLTATIVTPEEQCSRCNPSDCPRRSCCSAIRSSPENPMSIRSDC